MESTTDTHQRFQLRGVVCPARERCLNGGQLFASLLNKQFDEIGIDMGVQLRRRRRHLLRVEHGGRYNRSAIGHCRRRGFRSRCLRSGFSNDGGCQVDDRGFMVRECLQHHRCREQLWWQWRGIRHDRRRIGSRRRCRLCDLCQMHHYRQQRSRQGPQTGLRIVEHVFWVSTAGLERFHVVLDAHHGVGEAVESLGSQRRRVKQNAMHFHRQRRHNIAGTLTVQHPEGRTNTPRQFIHGGGGHCHLLRHRTGHRFLDARKVDDALAQHRRLHALLLGIVSIVTRIALLIFYAGRHQTDERLVEPILHADEGGCHFHEQPVAWRQTTRCHVLEPGDFRPHPRAQGS